MAHPIITSRTITGSLHTPGILAHLGAGHGVGTIPEIQSVAGITDELAGED